MRRFHSSRETVDRESLSWYYLFSVCCSRIAFGFVQGAAGTSPAEFCSCQETDQETQRNSKIHNSDLLGVAHVRLASEGTGNSEVV